MYVSPENPERPRCESNPDLWFSELASKIAKAKKLCANCTFQAQCLKDANAYEEVSGEQLHGVFGGYTREERAVLKERVS